MLYKIIFYSVKYDILIYFVFKILQYIWFYDLLMAHDLHFEKYYPFSILYVDVWQWREIQLECRFEWKLYFIIFIRNIRHFLLLHINKELKKAINKKRVIEYIRTYEGWGKNWKSKFCLENGARREL